MFAEFVEERVDGGKEAFDALEVAAPFVGAGCAMGGWLEVEGGGAEIAEKGAGTGIGDASRELKADCG